MQTLTADQFQKKYGVVAADQFRSDAKKQTQDASLFDSIRNDVNQAGTRNLDIQNGSGSPLTRGVETAANTANVTSQVAGEALGRIPGVGGVLSAVGSAAKGAFDWASNKLSDTSLIKGAAGSTTVDSKGGTNYVPNKVGAEEGLRVASAGGQIAGDILGADMGSKGTSAGIKKGTDLATEIPGVASKVGDAMPDVSGATQYVKGAVRDIVPTRQNWIDSSLAKGLDLTPGDLKNVTDSTGNEVGRWMADNNLIGTNKATTQGLIKSFFQQNYNQVRSVINSVKKVYSPEEVPRLVDTLKQIQGEVASVPGLEKSSKEIGSLLDKKEFALSDVQRAKEILDDQYNIYSRSGEVSAGRIKQGLANIRGEIKSFIETEVKKETGDDIGQLNNNVATAKTLGDVIDARSQRGLTRAHMTPRDLMTGMGLTYFTTPLVGAAYIFIKKVLESQTARLRIARYLDSLDDAARAKISESLKEGKVPPDVERQVNQAEPVTP